MPNKPTTVPGLDTNQTNRTIPAPSKVTDGYLLNDILPASNANYLWGWMGDWMSWMDGTFGDGPTPGDVSVAGGMFAPSDAGADLGSRDIRWSDVFSSRGGFIRADVGYSALHRSMSGVELSAIGMDATGKYTSTVKFMSTDPAFTTENPKLLGAIAGRATENYGSDLDGGMALDFFVTADNPGATSLPDLGMSLNSVGLGIGVEDAEHALHIVSGEGIFLKDSSSTGGTPSIRNQGIRSDSNQSQAFAGRIVLEHWKTSGAIDDGFKGVLGSMIFGGNHTDGSEANLAYPASIAAVAEGTFTNVSTMPTGLSFRTGSLGRATPHVTNVDYGTEAMRIDASGNVGIGTSTPDTILHLYAGASGVTTPVSSTVATVESDGDAYISIITPAGNRGGLVCGDPGDIDAGQFIYRHDHTLPGWALYSQSLLTMKVDSGRRMWFGYSEDWVNEFSGATVPSDAQLLNLAGDASASGDVGISLWTGTDNWFMVNDGSTGEWRFTKVGGTNYTHLWLGYGGSTGYICLGDPALGTSNYVAIGKAPTADGILQLEMGGNDLHFMGASSTGTPSTAAGWIRVKIGGATRWIQTYSTTP